MTWIKPSFLWMMARSGWATKPSQERVLAIRIDRGSWEDALAAAVLTHPDPRVFPDQETWRRAFTDAPVRVQWDPERDLRGQKLEIRSIQVGIGRDLAERYNDHWIRKITDITPVARKIDSLRRRGKHREAKRHLPVERAYPLPARIAQRIGARSG